MAILVENYLDFLNKDLRAAAHEWQGPNIPYGDDSNRPNLIRQCTMLEGAKLKINCLRKLRDQAAMNPFYQHRIDRYIDEITDTYEPTEKPGTIPGNDFEETNVGEDTMIITPIHEALNIQEAIVRYKGKSFKVDEEGFLLSSDDYCKEWVEYTSKQIGIKKLTPKHHKIINFVRAYHDKNGVFPMIRIIMSVNNVDLKTLYLLFPRGPAYSLGRLTGFPFEEIEKYLR